MDRLIKKYYIYRSRWWRWNAVRLWTMYGDGRMPPRFWNKTVIKGGCWEWIGSRSIGNYGKYYFGKVNGKKAVLYAHRVCYEALIAVVPKHLDLDHLCRNRACVNPAHLEPVTRSENVIRGIKFTGIYGQPLMNANKTSCPQGHSYTPENIRIHKGGSRICKKCQYINDKGRIRDYRSKKQVLSN